MIIAEQNIQAVKETSIVEVIEHYIPLKRRGATYVALCPFHDERTPSFTVNSARNIFKCFGCGEGGDAIKFVMDYERKTFIEAVEIIAGITGISLERTEMTQRTSPKKVKQQPKSIQYDTIPLTFLEDNVQDVNANSLTKQLADIFGEEVVKEVLQDYRISLEPNGYILFPQIDRNGKYRTGKSIQYRDGHRTSAMPLWAHNKLKEKLPSNFKHKQCFTGEHLLLDLHNKPVAIVEGQSTMFFMAALSKAAMKFDIKSLQYFSSFTWLCTGGSDGIGWKDEQVFKALAGKQVMLFPDAGFYSNWLADAELMQDSGIKVQVSDIIEKKFQSGAIRHNEDLRDWFMQSVDQLKELIKQHQPISIKSDDIICLMGETHTPKDFNKLIILGIRLQDSSLYDIILSAEGELIKQGEQIDALQQLTTAFGKKLIPIYFDNAPCWAHKYN